MQYSRHDASNKHALVEIKYREQYYEDVLIEFDKFAFNVMHAELLKKDFLYANKMKNYLILFDILYLKSINYHFNWGWKKMPRTTEFGNTEMVFKLVGYINVRDCCEQIELMR